MAEMFLELFIILIDFLGFAKSQATCKSQTLAPANFKGKSPANEVTTYYAKHRNLVSFLLYHKTKVSEICHKKKREISVILQWFVGPQLGEKEEELYCTQYNNTTSGCEMRFNLDSFLD